MLQLGIFLTLLAVAGLLAWIAGFLYTRQQRFGADLLDVFQTAGIGSDIASKRRRVAASTLVDVPQRERLVPEKSWVQTALARLKPSASFKRTAQRFAVLTIVAGLGVAGYQFYRAHQTGINRRVTALSELIITNATAIYAQLQNDQSQSAYAPTPSAAAPTTQQPRVLGERSTGRTATPQGPYGPR